MYRYSENLFENELFGHAKGAFTDAVRSQKGLVQEANGGTLFLDEIGVISPYIQVKLLRFLQEKEYKPLGDSIPKKANVRIIAATNMNLGKLVEKKCFREDLFYRLDVVSLDIQPLRKRRTDIPILFEHFLSRYTNQFHSGKKGISEKALATLLKYNWQGNIRELKNSIQKSIVLSEGKQEETAE